MNPTTTQPKKKHRSARLIKAPVGAIPGILRITEGKNVLHIDEYFLSFAGSGFGAALHFEKFHSTRKNWKRETYSVNLDGEESLCECRGFERHHHCKHIEVLIALIEAGKLHPPRS